MANVPRRVSYILPAPSGPPPLLQLPPLGQSRRGQIHPSLVLKDAPPPSSNGFASNNPFADPPSVPIAEETTPLASHPRHCLGVNALALDTSTILAGESSPGGILYTGGRDGLVASWELHVPHKRRRGARYEGLPGRGGGRVKWERIGDGADMWDEDEDEGTAGEEDEEGYSSDEFNVGAEGDEGWVGVDGDRVREGMRRKRAGRGEVIYEERWGVDREKLSVDSPPQTSFRQSAQTHTDWVNAVLLCNYNQTLITASNDRTIRAWSPHSTDSSALSPALIGRHRDYVRSLAWAKYPSLLFSGALDRQVCVWDVAAGTAPRQGEDALLTIDLNKADDFGGVGMEGERGSVYALGTDPAGRVLAAGTPERVVRLWDPRVGDRSIGKLVGHSDCVRSVIVSEDGRHMLTGSSDTTIKLWSLGEHRCLHTFNHHTSSVWALQSAHPNLERFYSGSRDGHLCVVDVEQVNDMADGECVVLAKESGPTPIPRNGEYESKSGDEGIRCIVGMDDEFVWTATGSAEVRRWRDVGRRVNRLQRMEDEDDLGASYNQVSIPVPASTAPVTRTSLDGQDRSIAFAPDPSIRRDGLLSAIPDRLLPKVSRPGSINSTTTADGEEDKPTLNSIPYESLVCLGVVDSPYSIAYSRQFPDESAQPDDESSMDHLSPHRATSHFDQHHASVSHPARLAFQDREVASEASPLRKAPDEVITGRPGLIRSLMLNDRQHVLSVDTEGVVAVWNILRGVCVGRFSAKEVAAELDLERGIQAENAVRKHSVEVLEMVKDRVEGETMVITWCQVDTRIGSLVVHLEEGRVFDAEVYADEMGVDGSNPDTRINLGKWALANLFKGLVRAEEREIRSMTPSSATSSLPSISGLGARPIPIDRPNPNIAPHPHRRRALTGSFSGPRAPSLNIPGLVSPAARPALLPDVPPVDMSNHLSRSAPESGQSGWQSFHALRNGRDSGNLSAIPGSPASPRGEQHAGGRGDYFSSRPPRRDEVSPNRGGDERKTPTTPGSTSVPPTTPGEKDKAGGGSGSSGGKMMGKLKGFGRKKTMETAMPAVVEKAQEPEDTGPKVSDHETTQLAILDSVRSMPFHPPPASEAPPLDFPSSTALLISEESKDAGAWVVTYRSQVSSTEEDMESIEMNSPQWLLEYLFTGRIKQKDPVKLTFILEPVPGSGMKEMPDNSARLSASRVLRARKIMAFIYDRLELGPSRGRSGSVISITSRIHNNPLRKLSGAHHSTSSSHNNSNTQVITEFTKPTAVSGPDDLQPEDVIELFCGQTLVDPKITLATLKQYYGTGGDVTLHYRLREGVKLAP